MGTDGLPACDPAPVQLKLRHAEEAVDAATALLAKSRLTSQARGECALDVAALMGKLERLLSMLYQAADPVDVDVDVERQSGLGPM